MCRWTFLRSSAISLCPVFESSCVSENDVMPWIMVAPTMASTMGVSRFNCFLVITLSIMYRVEVGSTRPLTRLITISTKLNASIPRRGRTISRRSGQIARSVSDCDFFGLDIFPATSLQCTFCEDPRRSARRPERSKGPPDNPLFMKTCATLIPTMPSLFAGTSGFAYPSWKPDFYPAKLAQKNFLEPLRHAPQRGRDQLHVPPSALRRDA